MEEIKKTIEEINSQIEAKNQEISKAIESKASSESVKGLTDELEKIKEIAKTQGEALANLKTANEESTPLTFGDAVKNAIESHSDKIASVKNGTAKGEHFWMVFLPVELLVKILVGMLLIGTQMQLREVLGMLLNVEQFQRVQLTGKSIQWQ